MDIHRDMKLLISIAFLAAACGGSSKPAGNNEASVADSTAANEPASLSHRSGHAVPTP